MQYYAAMRTAVKTAAVSGTAAAVLAALLAAPSYARDARAAAADRWIPSFAIIGGVGVQQQQASVDSWCADGGPGDLFVSVIDKGSAIAPCIGLGDVTTGLSQTRPFVGSVPGLPAEPATPFYPGRPATYRLINRGTVADPGPWGAGGSAALRPADGDDELAISPYVGANLQLLTPVIPRIPGGPRLFVSGEVQFAFPPTYKVANEGDASGAVLPDSAEGGVSTVPVSSYVGVGSETTSEVQMIAWGAKVGIAFPFRVFGRTLWVKPGAAWTQYEIEVEGRVAAALKDDCCPDRGVVNPEWTVFNPGVPKYLFDPANWGSNMIPVNLSADTQQLLNGIGPSLEFEMDVGRFGPVQASLFLGGAMYRILGNRTVNLTASQSVDPFYTVYADGTRSAFPTLPGDTYTANWSFEADKWMYQAGVGIRFHWLGN